MGGYTVYAAITPNFIMTEARARMCSITSCSEINIYLASDGKVHNTGFIAIGGEEACSTLFEVLPRELGNQ
jgi:hypothetical protein